MYFTSRTLREQAEREQEREEAMLRKQLRTVDDKLKEAKSAQPSEGTVLWQLLLETWAYSKEMGS